MFVYLIVNKINNKLYIGSTIQSLSQRWSNHVWEAQNRSSNNYFHRAIRKYGKENFHVELIDTANSLEELDQLENECIQFFNTLSPYGYNSLMDVPTHRVFSKEFISRKRKAFNQFLNSLSQKQKEEIYTKIQYAHQGKKRNEDCNGLEYSSYIGVIKRQGKYWQTCLTYKQRRYSKFFKSEVESAIAYDKMVLYLFGKDAKLNFPNQRSKYLMENLQLFYNFFIQKTKTSKYKGVSWDKNRKKWQAQIKRGQNKRISKRFDSEEEASRFYKECLAKIEGKN